MRKIKTHRLTEEDKGLIEVAKATIINAYRRNHKTDTTNGAAIITENGTVYRGVNVEVRSSPSVSLCAEMGAVNQMMTNNETEIKTVVTYWLSPHNKNNWKIIPPCGACRHLLRQFGDPYIIISPTKKTRLSELIPYYERAEHDL